MSDWTFNGAPFDHDEHAWAVGFVYLLTCTTTGEKYIGKKFLTSTTRKAVKGSTRKKVTRKKSNWEDYYGSSKRFLDLVEQEGRENIKREILSLHEHKNDVNYNEMKQQVLRDVLNDSLYLNENIILRFYRRKMIPKSAFAVD